VMVRPEQIRFDSQSNRDAVPAQVLAVTFFGHDASVLVSLEAGVRKVTMRVPGHAAPSPGAEAWLNVEGVVMAYPRAQAFANPNSRSTKSGVYARAI
jgi:iron(III) transport system ATP-binding protein